MTSKIKNIIIKSNREIRKQETLKQKKTERNL
nr:MAG TPA: hypothetical protein [Siphoviridae sp. ctD5s5]